MSTLGNERRVVRVDVTNPQFRDPTVTTPIATDDRTANTTGTYPDGHTFSRGQLVVFSSVTGAGSTSETMHVEFDGKAVLELLLRPQNITACGVVAEAFTDTRPAGNLGGRRRLTSVESRRVALPVTFNGIEFVAGTDPHTGFSPGDYVYVVATGDDKDPFTTTRLCRYDELMEGSLNGAQIAALEAHRKAVKLAAVDPVVGTPFTANVVAAVYVGIAHTHADRGATSAEVLFAPV
jgi:hypothetical protein